MQLSVFKYGFDITLDQTPQIFNCQQKQLYRIQNWASYALKVFCFGAACAEIEIDVLTGLYNVIRVDILMDVGDSLNPAIDIG